MFVEFTACLSLVLLPRPTDMSTVIYFWPLKSALITLIPMLNWCNFYVKRKNFSCKKSNRRTSKYTELSHSYTHCHLLQVQVTPTLIVAFSELYNNVNYFTLKLFVSNARIKFRIFWAITSIENKQIDKRQTISFQSNFIQFIFL